MQLSIYWKNLYSMITFTKKWTDFYWFQQIRLITVNIILTKITMTVYLSVKNSFGYDDCVLHASQFFYYSEQNG